MSEVSGLTGGHGQTEGGRGEGVGGGGGTARRTTTQPTRVRNRGDSAATIRLLIPPDY